VGGIYIRIDGSIPKTSYLSCTTRNYCLQCNDKRTGVCSLKARRDAFINSTATALAIELREVHANVSGLTNDPLSRGVGNVIQLTLKLLEEIHPDTFATVSAVLDNPTKPAGNVIAVIGDRTIAPSGSPFGGRLRSARRPGMFDLSSRLKESLLLICLLFTSYISFSIKAKCDCEWEWDSG
jgi:hypothetical protein